MDDKKYDLHLPMNYMEFKAMPLDLQKEYIDYLQSRFNASLAAIGRDLFGLSICTLPAYLDRAGIDVPRGPRSRRIMSTSQQAAWAEWLGVAATGSDTTQQGPVRPSTWPADSISITVSGELDVQRLIAAIEALPVPAGEVNITVEITKCKEDPND